MIYILLGQTKSIKKQLSRPTHLKLKKIQGLFKDLHRHLRTFQGKMEFKDFSRTSPKIQGLFKTVWTLHEMRELFYNFDNRIILALFRWLIILFPKLKSGAWISLSFYFFPLNVPNMEHRIFYDNQSKKQNLTNKTIQAVNLSNDKSISLTLHTLHDLSVVCCHSESEHKTTSINHETDQGTGSSTSSSTIPVTKKTTTITMLWCLSISRYFRNQR